MKTIKIISVFLFSIFLLLACNKEEVITQTQSQEKITLNNNRIIFNTYSDYENHIDNYQLSENPQEFISNFKTQFSLTQSVSRSVLPDALRDDFLESILNDNNIVQIGNYLYKINLVTQKVFVLEVNDISKYNDLVNENVSNSAIEEYSTEDDVIDLVENLNNSVSRGCGGVGGGEYQSRVIDLGVYEGNPIQLQSYVKFYRAGIYFSLKGGVKFKPEMFGGTGAVESSLYIDGPGCWYIKRPCRDKDIRIKNPGLTLNWGSDHTREKRVYSGMRNLSGYYFFVKAKGRLLDQNGNWQNIQTTDAAGRNISSPW